MKFGNIIKRPREKKIKKSSIKKCGFVSIYDTKLEYLSSIVFHTVILKMLSKDARIKKCGLVSIYIGQSRSIYHQ